MLAMQNVDEQGVWGGSIESERDYMRRYKVTPQEYVNIECGTEAAYFKHRRLREIPCADCKSVNAATRRRQMANGKKRVY
jgi:hypothetical protein